MNKFYGRGALAAVLLPYLYMCGIRKGYLWKGLSLYAILRLFDSIYDSGMYLRFFIHGPKDMRRVAILDQEKSFAAIQMHLF